MLNQYGQQSLSSETQINHYFLFYVIFVSYCHKHLIHEGITNVNLLFNFKIYHN
jgi:hypothetical protein